ncbi:hypothetical protein CAEBREN_05019 [Caenorhabditis brenneri]|uniref:Uncharacterized protein n=1 Tax=Caenorhabditis brenneri TaxID=135651 RepID=G0PK02_CAEBE|nr:hypothetical protein CAEBREN_05019 [Caenorhabditis brenneri]
MGTKKAKESSTSSRRKTTPPIIIPVKSTEDSAGPIAYVKEVVVETQSPQRPSHRSPSRSPKRSRSPSPLHSSDSSSGEDNEDEHEVEDQPENPADTTDTLITKKNDLHSTEPADIRSHTLLGPDKAASEFRRNLLNEVLKIAADNEDSNKKFTSIFTPALAKQLSDTLSCLKTSMYNLGTTENSLSKSLGTVASTTEDCYKEASKFTKLLSDTIGGIRSTERLFQQAVRENSDLVQTVGEHSAKLVNLQDTLNRIEYTLNTMKDSRPLVPHVQDTLNEAQHSLAIGHPSALETPHQLAQRAPAPIRPPVKSCTLCAGPHWAVECTIFRTSQQRKDRATAINVCRHCARAFDPDTFGKHAKCKRANVQCTYCAQTRDFDETLHHIAFCSLLSEERMNKMEPFQSHEQSRKRSSTDDVHPEQDQDSREPLQPPVFNAIPSRGSSYRGKRPRGVRGRGSGHHGQRPTA